LCGPMKNSFARLFERARQEVPLRPDLTSAQLLSMVSALPKDARTGRTVEPCLRVVLDGLLGARGSLAEVLSEAASSGG
jgi:hypothetical protein